jgi:hypothetical protein
MDMSKVNMHKRMAMTGKAADTPAKVGHFRGGGLAKRGLGKALAEGGLTGAEFRDRVGRRLGRRTRDAEGRAMMQPMRGSKKIPPLHPPKKKKITKKPKPHQGYKAREDESLGMRTGKESTKHQSMRARRDESYGKWGKRPDQRINRAKGGSVRKQGYKAREDESLGMRTGKESGKKQSMKARRDESYGKWGSRPNQRINRAKGGVAKHKNTRRENILEEKGRVDAEKAYTRKGRKALGAEQRRLARELNKRAK